MVPQKPISKLCRLCLTPSPMQRLINSSESEMLLALTSIEVKEDGSIPRKACIKCLLNLKLAAQIQQKFLQSYKLLLNLENEKDKKDEAECKKNCSDMLADKNMEKFEIIEEFGSDREDQPEKPPDRKLEDVNLNVEVSLFPNSDLARCLICGERDVTAKHFQKHYESHQKCDKCNVFLGNIREYNEHTDKKHLTTFLTCSECSLCFKYQTLYNIHMATLHPIQTKTGVSESEREAVDSEGITDCPDCGKTFINGAQCLRHRKVHERVKCHLCSREVTRVNFRAHYKSHTPQTLVCHICGRSYSNETTLRSHIHYTHSKLSLPCDYCGKIFRKKYCLRLHVKKEHTGEKSHICDTCGKGFFTWHTLNKHVKMRHLKERNFVCRFCKKGLSSRYALRTHERQHTNECPFECDTCGEKFRQRISLRWHMQSKHSVIEEKPEKCKVCDKKFGSKWAVDCHMRYKHV